MRNIESEISPHSKQILNPGKEYFECNCRVRNECNLDNKCLTPNTAYEAKVSNETNDECKIYLGASETTFKERFRNHIRDYKHKKYEKCTELSKYIWILESQGTTLIVKWSVVRKLLQITSNRKVLHHSIPQR